MTTLVLPQRSDFASTANAALHAAVRFWFTVAVIGQWLFLYYIGAFYGSSALERNFALWTKNKMLITGYVPGDRIGNLNFLAHALLAGIIAFGGAIQLIPQIRARATALHRWNGRLFFVTAIGLSLSGLYLVWIRGTKTSTAGAFGVSLNGVLIITFAILAWRTAAQRNLAAHRRWALRSYIVANGQWFTRVSVFATAILTHGHMFFAFWNFGSYLVPLAVLELYLRTKENGGVRGRFAMAGVLTILTLVTCVGIVGVSMFLWKTVLTKI